MLEVTQPTSQPLVELSYGVAVDIDAGDFPRLFLMMQCADGSAATVQGNRSAEWRRGQTLPFSAGFETRLHFDQSFVQKAVRLDADALETLCSRWLGRPLEQPLRFALQPFSNDFERIWRRTLAYLWSSEDGGVVLTGAARAAFDEYLLTLLLQQHSHNYSEALAEDTPAPVPGVIRRAERFMADRCGYANHRFGCCRSPRYQPAVAAGRISSVARYDTEHVPAAACQVATGA